MPNSKEQKIVDEAHTIEINLTDKAGGGKIVVMIDDDGTISIAHRDTILGSWPAPVAYFAGRALMHMAVQVDPSLEDQL